MKNYKSGLRAHLSFFNNDINKFILLLRKGVSLYEYTDEWEKFHETSSLEKQGCYSILWKILQMQIICMQKEFVKSLK